MIKTTKVGLALWVLCMQGWLPSLVASCPQALRLTRAEDIFVLQRCTYLYYIRICIFSLHLCFRLMRALDLLVMERCTFWQILRLRNRWQVFRGNDGFSFVNVNIRMSSSLAFDKRVSDVRLYTFPGEHLNSAQLALTLYLQYTHFCNMSEILNWETDIPETRIQWDRLILGKSSKKMDMAWLSFCFIL